MNSANFAWKLSEKSQRCSKNGPTGHRSARFGPGVATKFTPKHYSNTFSDSFVGVFYEVRRLDILRSSEHRGRPGLHKE
jgi:hypothetical protein